LPSDFYDIRQRYIDDVILPMVHRLDTASEILTLIHDDSIITAEQCNRKELEQNHLLTEILSKRYFSRESLLFTKYKRDIAKTKRQSKAITKEVEFILEILPLIRNQFNSITKTKVDLPSYKLGLQPISISQLKQTGVKVISEGTTEHDEGDHDEGDHDEGDHDEGDHDEGDHDEGDHDNDSKDIEDPIDEIKSKRPYKKRKREKKDTDYRPKKKKKTNNDADLKEKHGTDSKNPKKKKKTNDDADSKNPKKKKKTNNDADLKEKHGTDSKNPKKKKKTNNDADLKEKHSTDSKNQKRKRRIRREENEQLNDKFPYIYH